jgi:hypothetical protein
VRRRGGRKRAALAELTELAKSDELVEFAELVEVEDVAGSEGLIGSERWPEVRPKPCLSSKGRTLVWKAFW